MPRKKKDNMPAPQPERELTPVEQERVANYKVELKSAPPAPKVKFDRSRPSGGIEVRADGPGSVLIEGLHRATGTFDRDLASNRLNQVASVSNTSGEGNVKDMILALAAMAGAKPQNEI